MKITEDAIVEQLINTSFTGIGTLFIAKSYYSPQTMDVGAVTAALIGATFLATGFIFSATIASASDKL